MTACVDRARRYRPKHTWDKDGVCVFCSKVNGAASEDDLPPRSIRLRKAQDRAREADNRAMASTRDALLDQRLDQARSVRVAQAGLKKAGSLT